MYSVKRDVVLDQLAREHIVSFPFLSLPQLDMLQKLINELVFASYKNFEVHVMVKGPELAEFSNMITDFIEPVRKKTIFKKPMVFDSLIVHKFQKHATPFPARQEKSCFIDLIAHLVIKGEGLLYVCDNEHGDNSRRIATDPGNLILVRGPGYCGMDIRPWHWGECKSNTVIIASFRKTYDQTKRGRRKPFF